MPYLAAPDTPKRRLGTSDRVGPLDSREKEYLLPSGYSRVASSRPLAKDRHRRDARHAWRSIQRRLSQRRRNADFQEQQPLADVGRAERARPVVSRVEGRRADRRFRLVVHLQRPDRFRSLFASAANGPKSLVENNATVLDFQSANGDSSRAGQLFNMAAYAGVSNRVLGAITAGRQDSFVKDALGRYDAMEAAKAFSLVGVSNIVAGAGDTEDARYNTSVQYRVRVGPLRFAALYQFGGYDQGNGSNGAFDVAVGGDFGSFSFDAVGSKVKDAVSLSNFGEYPLPSGVNPTDLKATLPNNTAGAAMANYSYNIATVYGGFDTSCSGIRATPIRTASRRSAAIRSCLATSIPPPIRSTSCGRCGQACGSTFATISRWPAPCERQEAA
jgi:hypothetical protein